ncbi:SGNH/GDSL hydrolase family protein [Gillisia sp. Hel_I_86]|uniref:SGNH/GDSL hydrolase family protein n=1 Tax=Gillisia sp. Hel_I_86 TaxID=1249981 RepID=UPI001645560C|nr:SGNH/GDSL hydrolase family protein [Gillisia sp. Hel_I_86]
MSNYNIEMWKYANELKTQDSVLGHVHKKSKEATLQNVEIKLNSLGMRSPEPNPDKKKILFLGSSISLGWGIENENSYAEIVNDRLNDENLDYQVLNASVGNYNTFRYTENFLRNQTAIDPEIIVINYFLNDAEILPMGSGNFLLKNSELAASVTIAIKKMIANNKESLNEHYNTLYEPENKGFKLMEGSLAKLAKYAKAEDIKVYLVLIPDIHFLQDYPFLPIHNKIKTISQDYDFEFIDLYETLKGVSFEKLQIIPGDSHPNEFGHTLIGKKLSDILISELK